MKVALQVNLAWPDVAHVYNIGYNGVCIGRVWLDRSASELPWEWLISLPMKLPATSTGRAASRKLALNALAAEWARLLNGTPKNRMDRVLTFARELEGPTVRKPAATGVEADMAPSLAPRVAPPPLPTTIEAQDQSKLTEPAAETVSESRDMRAEDTEAPVPQGDPSREQSVEAVPPDATPRAEEEIVGGLPVLNASVTKQLPMLTVAAVNHPPALQKLPRDLKSETSAHTPVAVPVAEHKPAGSSIFRDIVAVLSRHA
jgi:hypothetical protein